jgi:hypothetical protein
MMSFGQAVVRNLGTTVSTVNEFTRRAAEERDGPPAGSGAAAQEGAAVLSVDDKLQAAELDDRIRSAAHDFAELLIERRRLDTARYDVSAAAGLALISVPTQSSGQYRAIDASQGLPCHFKEVLVELFYAANGVELNHYSDDRYILFGQQSVARAAAILTPSSSSSPPPSSSSSSPS